MSAEKPLALLLTPVLPLPGGSGRALRAWSWLQELRREHRVLVLLPVTQSECPALPADYPAEAVQAIGDATRWTSRWRRGAGLFCPLLALYAPTCVVDWLLPAERAFLPALAGQPVRRILAFRLSLHPLALALAQEFPAARLELDMDDLESRTRLSVARALLRMGQAREALRMALGALQYALVERFVLAPYQTAYLAAEEDCRRVKTRLARAVACHPNRLPMPVALGDAPRGGEIRLIFVGTLNYPPNEEAVRDMLSGLVPALQRSRRTWRLRIVGRHAAPALRRLLEATPQLEFQPDVEDLAACYAEAQIVLVPLRSGGGTKLKTLEAFAWRRPVISTPQGVRGLGAVSGEHYLAAETTSEFVAAILRLADDPALSEQIVDAAHALCQREFAL